VPKMEQTPSSKLCWGCERNQRASQGPPGPLGVVLTSPPAVLGGPMKTGSKLPVLEEVDDFYVSDYIDFVLTFVLSLSSHDVDICDELGLDAGADHCEQTDSNTTTSSADRQQEPAGADVPEPERREGHSTSERPGDQTSMDWSRSPRVVRPLGHIVQGPASRAIIIFDPTLGSVRDLAWSFICYCVTEHSF
jgi:hypothetical protein